MIVILVNTLILSSLVNRYQKEIIQISLPRFRALLKKLGEQNMSK